MSKDFHPIWILLLGSFSACGSLSGCASHQARPSITAVGLSPANRCEPQGIPYYLPKPLLVVAKNIRHIDESKVGLTGQAPIPGGFDNQSSYADVKANVTVPSSGGSANAGQAAANIGQDSLSNAAIAATEPSKSIVAESMMPKAGEDFKGGLSIDSFFTYQIIFVPDLTQKYGLRISGGAGETRAAMNLVNGWMYTGMGPYYFKDSSSAQNAMASGVAAMYAGRGASDVINSVGNLASKMQTTKPAESATTDNNIENLTRQMEALRDLAETTPKVPRNILNYAEIYIYEPVLSGDQTEWRLVAEHHFDRDYFDSPDDASTITNKSKVLDTMLKSISLGAQGPVTESATSDPIGENLEATLTTPGGSTLRINRPAPNSATQESATSDPEVLNQMPAAVDQGANILNDQSYYGVGNSDQDMANAFRPGAQVLRPTTFPQVAINVMPTATAPKPVVQPSSSWFPKLHRFVHKEPARVKNQRGDTDTESIVTNP
jgi:hypothetical protein